MGAAGEFLLGEEEIEKTTAEVLVIGVYQQHDALRRNNVREEQPRIVDLYVVVCLWFLEHTS